MLATVYTCTREGSPEVSSYVSSLAIGIVMSVEYITTNETKTLVFLMIIIFMIKSFNGFEFSVEIMIKIYSYCTSMNDGQKCSPPFIKRNEVRELKLKRHSIENRNPIVLHFVVVDFLVVLI